MLRPGVCSAAIGLAERTDSATPYRRHFLAAGALLLAALACVGADGAAAATNARARPLVKILKAPPARTSSTQAVFRLASRATRLDCRRDGMRYRRCGTTVRYRNLGHGSHVFTVRARRGKRTVYARHRWRIVTRSTAPATGSSTAGAPDAAAPPTPASPSSPSPPAAPDQLADGRKLVLGDEFDGTAIDTTRWGPYDGPGHAGIGLRRPSAVTLEGGNLVITARNVDGQTVSGAIGYWEEFTYGRVEFRVRAEMDPTGTMNAAVLTWPIKQWNPFFTENDMYETGPRVNNNYAFDSFIHFGTDASWVRLKRHDVDPTQWHTIAMEWYPQLLQIFVDGKLAFTVDEEYVIADNLQHVCIQLDPLRTTALTQPVRMWVDYVRVYQ